MITTILQHDSSMFFPSYHIPSCGIYPQISEYSAPGILQLHNVVKVIQYNFAHPRKPPNPQQTGDMKDLETPNLQKFQDATALSCSCLSSSDSPA